MRDTVRFGALALAAALFAALALPAAAQEAAGAPSAKIEPVFPVENEAIVFVEGEDAVSTNFAREPVLNYGCSGFRALQLNRSTGLEGVGSFYADFVFTVPSTGSWELWYGGTPPGPRDDLYPSYASPFQLTIDGQKTVAVSREAIAVVETYSPSFYWNLLGSFPLEARRHRLRFEVTEKRRFDGRYLFYLDAFFLVKKEGGKRVIVQPLPLLFPANLDARAMNVPFPSIDDMLIRVRDNPGAIEPLIELSLIYTMLGDNLSAIKHLNAAALIQPNPAIALLIAKNRIWKGDTAEGLRAYRKVLDAEPSRRELWLEAGKVAAWAGRFEDSIRFLTDGLAAFPKDLDLMVNLGLTYLWASRGQDAERVLREAQALAGSDPARLKEVARSFRVNGYPERALQAYNAAISSAPQDLPAYLLLIETLQAMGRTADADGARKRIVDTFLPSPRLDSFLESFNEKQGLKEQVLAEYRQRLAENPDNLVLRQTLAQAYFWNGQKDRAIEEYRHILANHAYLSIREAETRASTVLWPIDRGYLLADFFGRVPFLAQQKRALAASAAAAYRQAAAGREAAGKTLAAAKAAREKAKEGPDADKALAAEQAGEDEMLAADAVMRKQGEAVAALAADTRGLAGLIRAAKAAAAADRESTGSLQDQDAKTQEAFAAVVKPGGWTFDRSGTFAEVARDAGENALARLVAAKIHMMDRAPAAAFTLLAQHAQEPGAAAGASFTLGQSLLWSGRVKDAGALFAGLAAEPAPAVLPPYFAELVALQKSLESAPSPVPAEVGGDPLADLDAAIAGLAKAERDAAAEKDPLARNIALLQILYRRLMVRAFHAWDTTTSPIRNELGDYYLAEDPPRLAEAIVQFRKVLAIDPHDLSASFRLGKVYQWKRDWKSALDQYRAVYAVDPTYENVAALFNQVSRDHADSFSSLASYSAESQRKQWHAEAATTHLFNTMWGLAASYQTDDMRIQRDDGAGKTDHSAYQVHDIALGVPIEFSSANVKLTPWAGATVVAHSLFGKDTGTPVDPFTDGFSTASVDPVGRLEASVGLGNTVFVSTTMRWGRQPETLDPIRDARIYDASAEANLTTRFSFIDAWPFRDTSLRAYGKIDLLHTGAFAWENLLSTAVGELTVHVLKGGNPYSLLTVIGSVTYQASQTPESYAYYAPSEVFMAGGNLAGSTWIGLAGGSVLGLSLRAYGGTYQEKLLATGSFVPRIKAEGEANVSLVKGNATWTLTALATTTYNTASALWDYWSAFVRLGFTTRMPEILAP